MALPALEGNLKKCGKHESLSSYRTRFCKVIGALRAMGHAAAGVRATGWRSGCWQSQWRLGECDWRMESLC